MDEDEPQVPIDTANRILLSDPAIMAVAAVDYDGNNLAAASKAELPEKEWLTDDFIEMGVKLSALIMGSASQYEDIYGPLQSITVRFQKSKVMLLLTPDLRIVFVLRLIASANVDYIIASVYSLLELGRTEEGAGKRARTSRTPRRMGRTGEIQR